jgi:hypothetical protein
MVWGLAAGMMAMSVLALRKRPEQVGATDTAASTVPVEGARHPDVLDDRAGLRAGGRPQW